MLRSPHYLRPSRATAIPRCIAGIALDLVREPSSDGSRTIPISLGGWAMTSAYTDGRENDGLLAVAGHDEESLWRHVALLAAQCRGVSIYGLGMSSMMTSIGAWRRLDDGRMLLGTRAVAGQDDDGGSGRKTWTGMAMIDDPPWCLITRLSPRGGVVSWIDLGNYGVKVLPCPDHPIDRARISLDFALSWIEELRSRRWGGMKVTAASQAMHTFRHAYHRSALLVHAHPAALQLERESIYPGRCECFRIGLVAGDCHHYDWQSCYPQLCLGAMLPARLAGYAIEKIPEVTGLMESGYQLIARCRIRTESPDYPLRRNGRTIYPVGAFITSLAGPEFAHALERKRIQNIMEVAWYEPGDFLSTYMADMIGGRRLAREEGDKAKELMYKLLANSLIGKFAQHNHFWAHCQRSPAPDNWAVWWDQCQADGPVRRHRSIGPHVQHEVRDGEHPESMPQVASWIYSTQRIRLASLINTLGRAEVYYVDTDSLWISEAGQRGMLARGGNAVLSVSLPQYVGKSCGLNIRGPKQYRTDNRAVESGIPAGSAAAAGGGRTWYSQPTINEAVGGLLPPQPELVSRSIPDPCPIVLGQVRATGQVDPMEVWE